ncbi:uncharacterized protein JCM6883_002762 [Sporobolomyces salmoneus]|uniref:uncharacterized protein n=1 Tax=Sporobolomyces salmoneus TaxID=183962 RepID=UPI003180C114
MWNSLSGSLSSYLNSAPAQSSSSDSVNNTPSTPPISTAERVKGQQDDLDQDPHTPEQNSQRLSPNSLSASGNQTMAGILAAHPQFSVFRKSTSREGLDELLLERSREMSRREQKRTEEESEENRVETLVTPPASSPRENPLEKRTSPSGNSSGSSSFHFSSLEGADLPSLNFGDHSSSGSLVGVSPRSSPLSASNPTRPTSPPRTTQQQELTTSGVRLIPDSPPPAATPNRSPSLVSSSSSFRPSSSSSRPTRTPSRSSSSSSLSRSQSVTRVGQFSPLSLCPSPLIGAPTLPPPPPPPALPLDGTPDDLEKGKEVRGMRRTSSILKLPRTPGTGRSVRFTESIIDHERSLSDRDNDDDEGDDEAEAFGREESPSVVAAAASRQHHLHLQRSEPRFIAEEQTESALDFSAMTSKDSILTTRAGGGGGHSSFLDKLKEVIPSPDVSLVVEEKEEEEMTQLVVQELDSDVVAEMEELSQTEDLPSTFSTTTTAVPLPTPPSTLSPTDDPSSSISAIQAPTNLSSTNPMLFDESNPCHFNNSISVLGSSTLGTVPGLAREVVTMEALTETEEEEEDEWEAEQETSRTVPTTPRATTQQREHDISRTPTSNPGTTSPPARTEEDEESPLQHSATLRSSNVVDESHHDQRLSRSNQVTGEETISTNATILPLDESSSATPSSSSTLDLETSQSQSFYRKFMASRAKIGGSQTAAEEWDRLARGEKASPKEQSNQSIGNITVDEVEGMSVYYSPVRGEIEEEEEGEEVERVLVQGGSFYELAPAYDDEVEVEENEDSVVDYGGLVRTFLSPIVELSEPESTANSPFEELLTSLRKSQSSRPKPPPTQPTFSSSTSRKPPPSDQSLVTTPSRPSRHSTVAPSTPLSASKIPRPRNPITPSQNPFLLQLARCVPNAPPAVEQQVVLIQQLLSTQQDQIETTNSQRFLLSSLVNNLQNEVEQKNRMVENLKRQVVSARREVQEVERIALDWQNRRGGGGAMNTEEEGEERRKRERSKVAALEETVRLLADELDTRLKENGLGRKRIEGELERTRTELVKRSHEVRDTEIRLRHTRTSQLEAEEEIKVRREREETAKEEARESKREIEMFQARWQAEVEDRDRTTRRLREELQELKEHTSSSLSGPQVEERIEKEVSRRVEEAQREFEKQTSIVKQELVHRDSALADLRSQLRSAQEEAHQTRGISQEDRQQAELALADLQTQLVSKEEEIVSLREANSELQDEFDETVVKFEDASIDRDRLIHLLESKEVELGQQQEQCDTAISAMRDLEAAVTRFESEAVLRENQLAKLQKELELQSSVLEKREGVLVECEKQLSRLRKEREILEAEKEKAAGFAEKLKRDSADREIRVSKLKKRIAELDEDVFGLNIALDAKQQEASHWKRQMTQLKRQSQSHSESLVPPSSTARHPASTVRRSNTTSVLSGLENHTLSSKPDQQGTPFSKSSHLSRRSSRSNLLSASSKLTQSNSQSSEHDLTLPDHEETPSRLPPLVSSGTVSTAAQPIRRSTSSSSKLIQFPKVPQGDQDRLGGGGMTGLGLGVAGGTNRQKKRSSSGQGQGGGSKENEPIKDGAGSTPSSRRSSASFGREAVLA